MPKILNRAGEVVYASDKAAPVLIRDHGFTALDGAPAKAKTPKGNAKTATPDATPDEPKEPTLEERIAAVSSHDDANALGAELGVALSGKKPGLDAKKAALLEAAKAKAAEPEPDGLDELSDEDLAAKVAERYPDYDAETIATAIAEKRDEVVADLRGNTAAE